MFKYYSKSLVRLAFESAVNYWLLIKHLSEIKFLIFNMCFGKFLYKIYGKKNKTELKLNNEHSF